MGILEDAADPDESATLLGFKGPSAFCDCRR